MSKSSLPRGASRSSSRGATKIKSLNKNTGKVLEPKYTCDSHANKKTVFEKNHVNAFNAYWQHHVLSLGDSLKRLKASPVSSVLTISVVAIALVLPALLFLMLLNIKLLAGHVDQEPSLSVYLEKNHRALEEKDSTYIPVALLEKINALSQVQDASFISAQQGLIELSLAVGMSDLIESLDQNPLPSVIKVTAKNAFGDTSNLLSLQKKLSVLKGVDEVVMDLQWVQRLNNMLEFWQKFMWFISGLLILGLFIVVGNTVRLVIEDRREEIAISDLIGATRAYIRRPFLYTGFCYGFLGAILTVVLLIFCQLWLSNNLSSLAQSYSSDWQLVGINSQNIGLLIAVGSFVGWLAALVAMSRHFSKLVGMAQSTKK